MSVEYKGPIKLHVYAFIVRDNTMALLCNIGLVI